VGSGKNRAAGAEVLGALNKSQILDLNANSGNTFTPAYSIYLHEGGKLIRVALINFVTDSSGASDILGRNVSSLVNVRRFLGTLFSYFALPIHSCSLCRYPILQHNSPQLAIVEAGQSIQGDFLLGFQAGNEPDLCEPQSSSGWRCPSPILLNHIELATVVRNTTLACQSFHRTYF
jgi:hypothetical protein